MPLLEISMLRGSSIEPHIEELAALRIGVFREWPYLYDGTVEYERDYLSAYTNCADSVVVLATSGGRIVGASTALPLASAAVEFRQAFEASDYSADEVFYFGESVLLKDFRGHGAGRKFFSERERAAVAYGSKYCAFCTVDRQPDDPRRPEEYRDLGAFWKRLGYMRQPAMQARFRWRELGRKEEKENTLTFWINAL